MAGKYVSRTDLENALSVQTVLTIYDDGTGVVDDDAVDGEISRAEAEVDSYLEPDYTLPLSVGSDRLVKHAALQFLICFSFERHPEYVRTFGEEPRSTRLYDRATALMMRIASAQQQLPDQPTAPGNSGGVVYSDGPRLMIDRPDGRSTRGDF